MEKPFLNDICVARIILIVLLVLYHSFAPFNGAWKYPENLPSIDLYWWIATFSYSFMLPMFVFISGYLVGHSAKIHRGANLTAQNLIYKKIRRLLLPSICFSIIYFFIFRNIENSGNSIIYYILNGAGHMWFLPMLFWNFVFLYFIEKYRNYSYRVVLFLSLILSSIFLVSLPFRLSNAIQYFFFFYLGYVSARFNILLSFRKKSIIISLFLFYVSSFILCNLNSLVLFDITFGSNLLHKINYALVARLKFLLPAISGVLFIWTYISNKVDGKKLSGRIIKLSSYCFGVYIFQQFILKFIYYNLGFISTESPYVLPWVAFGLTLCLSVLMSAFFVKTKIGKFLIG